MSLPPQPNPRYSRQARLAEVGSAGQARIERTRFVASSPGEADYLRRAGALRVELRDGTAITPGPAAGFRFATTRALAGDALRALAGLRDALRAPD